MLRCENCGETFEHADELEKHTVEEVELEEGESGPPRIQIGAGQRDVWRCKGCGKVLGVS